jgi:hypothetical protein
MTRKLLAVELQNEPFSDVRIDVLKDRTVQNLKINRELADYYVFTSSISNLTYAPDAPEVMILLKNGSIADITTVSDMFDHRLLSERVTKYFLCYPKEFR